ncbi:hypothetical protein RQP46_003946 [Phenoliferia psychrophenolica]
MAKLLLLAALGVQAVLAAPRFKRAAALTTSGPLPDYAFTYAPVNYLKSDEGHWPSTLQEHLANCEATLNRTLIPDAPSPLNLSNLNFMPGVHDVYATSKSRDISGDLDWQISLYGKPNSTGYSESQVHMIAVDKSELIAPGTVDVFYFYWYSFNLGPKVEGVRFGLHNGDWELSMIRFLDGVPQSMFYSQHSDGEAFTYEAVEKEGVRPVLYVATGSHANYATAGQQDYGFPAYANPGILADYTDKGHLWDSNQNNYQYWYSVEDGFVAAPGTDIPLEWLSYVGYWGDEAASLS